jgi:D-alanyl-D-alanine carboxypeptidase
VTSKNTNKTQQTTMQRENTAREIENTSTNLNQTKAEDVFSHILLGGHQDLTPVMSAVTKLPLEHTPPEHDEPEFLLAPPVQAPLRRIPALLLIVTALFSYAVGYFSHNIGQQKNPPQQEPPKTKSDPFTNINLEAKAAYVYDVADQNVLYALHEHDELPLASLTKLMTAITATQILPPGTTITIGKDDINQEGDSGLFIGERWRLSDIIGFTLTTSSNDGASAIATVAGSKGQNIYGVSDEESQQKFVEQMNTNARALNLPGMHFFNPMGLDVNQEISGGYGTARDVALLMAHALKTIYPDLELTSHERIPVASLDNFRHIATNTNESIGSVPALMASKTGYTDLAGGNLVIAFDAGIMHPIIVAVLGSTVEGRFKDVEKLSWAALQSLDR